MFPADCTVVNSFLIVVLLYFICKMIFQPNVKLFPEYDFVVLSNIKFTEKV